MASGSYATLSVRDYGEDLDACEYGVFTLPSYQIDAANLATWLTGWGEFKTALEAITAGVLAKENVAIYNTVLSDAIPASPFAQRETKILVTYQGNTSARKFRIELPCPDLTVLTLTGKDKVTLADGGVMAAFVTAFQAIARNPYDDAETVTVIGAKVVGRNI